MIKTMIFTLVSCSLLPFSVFAQQVDVNSGIAETQFRGTAGFACLVSSPQGNQITGATFTASGSVAQLAFQSETVVDPATLIARPFSVSLSVPVTCNGAHSVTVRSARGGMQLATPVTQAIGLASRIDFNVRAVWLGDSNQISTFGSPIGATISKTTGASGSVEVTVNGRAGSDPLVAGRYSDEIIVDLIALL